MSNVKPYVKFSMVVSPTRTDDPSEPAFRIAVFDNENVEMDALAAMYATDIPGIIERWCARVLAPAIRLAVD